jgi:YesN/AraC family two-component response regulator
MYRITKGDMIFIDAGVPHRATTTNRLERERVIINFKQELLQSKQELLDDSFCPFGSDSPVLSLHVNEQKYVEELFHRMCEEYQGKRRNYLICIEALLVELLVFAIRCNETRLERPKKQPKPLHPVIIEAMRYIDRHYAERLTLDSISERFSTSKYYLSRLFKTTGCTFVEYVAHVRTTEAQKLLRESDWSVTRVAEEVGFDNLAHFYKTFKHYSSHSPLKYRKINRLI